MTGYTPAEQDIRAARGLPYATGADDPPRLARPARHAAGSEASSMTTINVTAEHIEMGEQGESDRCPVALAIRSAIPGLWDIAVGPAEISIIRYETGPWVDFDAPPKVAEFIETFDGGTADVEPFAFELDYPAEVAA